MIYAMLSIGILGFIVFAHHNILYYLLKSSYSELYTLPSISSFLEFFSYLSYSLKLSYMLETSLIITVQSIYLFGIILIMEQSAGNKTLFFFNTISDNLISDNETSNSDIPKISDHLNNVKPINDDELGYYLAGLIEGNGYFNDKSLVITFHEKDAFLAYFLKKRIGYGSVVKDSKAIRLIITKKEGLIKVLNLVNGKFFHNIKINQIINSGLSLRLGFNILPKNDFKLNTNHWLAGFSDSDSSFDIRLRKDPNSKLGFYVKLRFLISQKDDYILNKIQNLFGGSIYHYKVNDCYYYGVNSIKDIKGVIDYFDIYSLNSSKFITYLKFRKTYRILQRKEHLTKEGLEKIKLIIRNLRD